MERDKFEGQLRGELMENQLIVYNRQLADKFQIGIWFKKQILKVKIKINKAAWPD